MAHKVQLDHKEHLVWVQLDLKDLLALKVRVLKVLLVLKEISAQQGFHQQQIYLITIILYEK
jgi:hypothetical protein